MNILAILRPENVSLARALLQRRHSLWVAPREVCILLRKIGYPCQPFEEEEVRPPAVTGTSGVVDTLIAERQESVVSMSRAVRLLHQKEGLDAVVVWTDAPAPQRAAVLTAKALGIPTFEVTHGAMNTYRQGHFECESHVDHILAPGKEEEDFRAFYGSKAQVHVAGKPSFDWMKEVNRPTIRASIREHLGLPDRRPLVLYGMTWRHPFSTWERDSDLGEKDVFEAHMNLQAMCAPYLVVKPHYARSSRQEIERLARYCEGNGIEEYAITGLDTAAILPAVDLVVSHKSSLLVEAVLMGIPALGFDFRERNDFAFYQGLGIEWVSRRSMLREAMSRCLLDRSTRERLARERENAAYYFNGPNDGRAAERCADILEALCQREGQHATAGH